MTVTLSKLIDIAGAALEAEDRVVLGASVIHGERSGIIRWGNEHFYQYVVCRSWLSRWHTAPEKENRYDAVISIAGNPVAAVEMKRWWSEEGKEEIPRIRTDIEKLKKANSENAFLIIFSANNPTQTDENIRFLNNWLPELSDKPMHLYSFPTLSPYEDSLCEFWIAGWQMK
jgi:hypothetical protein